MEGACVVIGFWLAGALVCAFVGYLVGKERDRGDSGVLLGLLLGPIGVVVTVLLPPTAEWQARRELEVEAEKAAIRAQYERMREQVRRSPDASG